MRNMLNTNYEARKTRGEGGMGRGGAEGVPSLLKLRYFPTTN